MTKEQKLKEEIRSLQNMIAGLPELDDPGQWLPKLLVQQLENRSEILEELRSKPTAEKLPQSIVDDGAWLEELKVIPFEYERSGM